MIRRPSIAALTALIALVGASNASAGPVSVGYLTGDDHPSFGLTVTVVNDSGYEPELAGGDAFHALVLDLLDASDVVLATYTRASLDVAESWVTPDVGEPTTQFLAVARVNLSLLFRGVSLRSSLQTCAVDGDGCFADVFGPIWPAEDVCVEAGDACELVGRQGGNVIEYDAPVTSVPDAGVPLADAAASMLAIATALRYRRMRRIADPDVAPRA